MHDNNSSVVEKILRIAKDFPPGIEFLRKVEGKLPGRSDCAIKDNPGLDYKFNSFYNPFIVSLLD
jgi:hypothetical protein